MPYYHIIGPDDKSRLIKADNQAQALRHAARVAYKVEAASTDLALDLVKAGVELESASRAEMMEDA